MTEVARPEDLAAAPDVIVVAVKLFDVEAAALSCAAWPDAVTLTVSNGVGAEEIVRRIRPGAGLIAGSVTASVDLVDERTVARLNGGGIGVAPAGGRHPPVGRVARRRPSAPRASAPRSSTTPAR